MSTECENCKFREGDCGYHHTSDGVTNYNIASLNACDKYGNCMFFERMDESKGDLISREALKKQIAELLNYDDGFDIWVKRFNVEDLIDNAPTVEPEITNDDLQAAMTESYHLGYELAETKFNRPQGKWITDRQPDKNGTYLCVVTLKGANVYFRNILSYATDLYEVDNFDFQKYRYKKKTDRAGWYDLDSEYGYIHFEDDSVVAWMELPELPEPYKGEKE